MRIKAELEEHSAVGNIARAHDEPRHDVGETRPTTETCYIWLAISDVRSLIPNAMSHNYNVFPFSSGDWIKSTRPHFPSRQINWKLRTANGYMST